MLRSAISCISCICNASLVCTGYWRSSTTDIGTVHGIMQHQRVKLRSCQVRTSGGGGRTLAPGCVLVQSLYMQSEASCWRPQNVSRLCGNCGKLAPWPIMNERPARSHANS